MTNALTEPAMITLYGCPTTRSTRAAWALEEAGAEYAYVRLDLSKGDGRQPAYLAINPGGKVPTLVDGDLRLTESAAICTYIGDNFPAAGTARTGRHRHRGLGILRRRAGARGRPRRQALHPRRALLHRRHPGRPHPGLGPRPQHAAGIAAAVG